MSEVLGTVLLTATTVVLLGGFGVVLLTSVNDTADPPTGAFSLEAAEGADHVTLRFVSGTAFPVDGARVVLLVNGTDRTGTIDLRDSAVAGAFSPGGTLRVNLSSGVLPADAALRVLLVDQATGKAIGTTAATLLSASTLPPFVTGVPAVASISFSPAILTVDGLSLTNVTVQVDSPFGLDLVRSVTLNLTTVGGPAETRVLDDGQGPDVLAGDGLYTGQMAAVEHEFASAPSTALVRIPVLLRDVFGKTAEGEGVLVLETAPLSKVSTGAKWRNIPASDAVDHVNLTAVTYRDATALGNDQVQIRVSDLDGTTDAWTALVTFASPATCGGSPGVLSVQLSRDGVSGSATYTPTATTCFSLDGLAKLNLADPTDSLGSAGGAPPWTVAGNPSLFLYSSAGVSAINEATVTFLGDSVSPAPSSLGLGQADLEWARLGDQVPTASFTSGASGLTLSVDASASSDPDGGALTYAWQWGDGAASTGGVTNAHAYAASGSYTVNLTVTDTFGASATSSRVVTVTVANVGPTATLTANATTGATPLDVSFGLAGSDSDGSVASWTLSYGDGTSTSGTGLPTTRAKTYAAGTYRANLTVTDNSGAVAGASVNLTVNALPTASLSANVTAGTAPLDVGLTLGGSDAEGPIASWTLQYGDGATATGSSLPATLLRQYALRGSYQANLTVTDASGATATASVSIAVNQRPTASLAITGTSGLHVDVSAAGSADADGSVASYQWQWGDGATTTTPTPTTSRTYATGGSYAVNLTVTDNLGAASLPASVTTTPNRPPVVASLNQTALSDLNATLSASASDPDGQALTYAFAWGEGAAATTGASASASHAFARAGNFTVTVFVNDTLGGSASATRLVTLTQTLYASASDLNAAAPGGSVTSLGGITAADGSFANFTETNTGSTVSAVSGCNSSFTTQAPLSCTLGGLTWKVNSTSTGGTAGWTLSLDASQGNPTADGALALSPTSNGANTGRVNYHFNTSGAAGTTLTRLSLDWKMTANGGSATNSVTAVLVAPNGTSVTIGSASASGDTDWSAFTANVNNNWLTASGTYLLRIDYLSSRNGDVLNLDNLYLNWTATNTYRLQKELSLFPVPTTAGLTHHLEVSARQIANNEVLQVQVFDGASWNVRGNVSSSAVTTSIAHLSAAELHGGNVRVRLVDATTTGDAAASSWLIDYVRVVVRGP